MPNKLMTTNNISMIIFILTVCLLSVGLTACDNKDFKQQALSVVGQMDTLDVKANIASKKYLSLFFKNMEYSFAGLTGNPNEKYATQYNFRQFKGNYIKIMARRKSSINKKMILKNQLVSMLNSSTILIVRRVYYELGDGRKIVKMDSNELLVLRREGTQMKVLIYHITAKRID